MCAAGRDEFPCSRIEIPDGCAARIFKAKVQAINDSADVCVDRSIVDIECEGSDSRSGIRPDSGQGSQLFERRGQRAAVAFDDGTG